MPTRKRPARRPRAGRASGDLPETFKEFTARHPGLADAHRAIAAGVEGAGPLDARTRSLVKIGICAGRGLDSALRSHVRRAREAGVSPAEIEQAVLLAMNTIGFPETVAAWKRAREELARAAPGRSARAAKR